MVSRSMWLEQRVPGEEEWEPGCTSNPGQVVWCVHPKPKELGHYSMGLEETLKAHFASYRSALFLDRATP